MQYIMICLIYSFGGQQNHSAISVGGIVGEISVKLFESGQVVQKEMSFKD